MRNPALTFAVALLPVSFAGLMACSGAGQAARRPQPEAAVERCAAQKRAVAAAIADGSHTPIAMVALATAGTGAEPWTEARAAERILAAPAGGESWVVARGGSGKSLLARHLEAQLCGERLTFRVDVGLDLRAQLETATPAKPAIARLLLAQLGQRGGDDPAGQLRDLLGSDPWLLLLDGTDELTQSERKKLNREVEWLRSAGFGQHIVRFERPGMAEASGTQTPEVVLHLDDLTCAEADAAFARRLGDPAALAPARAWLTAHRLDRQGAGEPCRYVHMPTHRDVEVLADLAKDAQAAGTDAQLSDDVARDPTRADIFATWSAHRLQGIASTTEGALAWLDRIAAQGVVDKTEPDLRLTVNRCEGVATPGAIASGPACRQLMQSAVVRKSEASGAATLANRTLADLLLARWLVRQQSDCAMLASAMGEMASLEVAAMVASLPDGRRCLNPLVAAICSRGIPPADVLGFIDEAVPMGSRDAAFFAIAGERAHGACERKVFAGLK